MNAAVVHSFDAPPRYSSFPEPAAADGELIVDVIAAGVHPIAKAIATGPITSARRRCPSSLVWMALDERRMVHESILEAHELHSALFLNAASPHVGCAFRCPRTSTR
jgi:hypothetical protein